MIYQVEVIRTQTMTIYVETDDPSQAHEDARELSTLEDEWDDEDLDSHAAPVRSARGRYWTGGEQGRWVLV